MSKAMEKGDALHLAVASVEFAILSRAPGLGEKTFVIENKKIVRVNGVRHEVDIYVTVDPAPGYGSLHIFECKNWEAPVGKDEIVTFSEKIKVLNATRGYFVAKAFTKDARAQAKLDERVTLLLADEENVGGLASPLNIHSISVEHKRTDIQFRRRGSTNVEFQPLDVATSTVIFGQQPMSVTKFVHPWATQVTSDDTLKIRTHSLPEGSYEHVVTSTREFAPSELMLNGMDIERGSITVNYVLHVYHPPIISRFDIETRGRHYLFAPIVLPEGQTFQLAMTEGPDSLRPNPSGL